MDVGVELVIPPFYPMIWRLRSYLASLNELEVVFNIADYG